MKVTTKFFMLALILSLMLTVSAVAAADDISFDKSDTKDRSKNLLSTDDGKENLKTTEKTLNDETLSAKPDNNKLGDGQFTYSELRSQIGNGRNITLNKGTYTYTSGDGNTITISNSCTIDGNGSVIDMANSTNMRAFFVNANGVTIKNLTIKNANYTGLGGAIYFNQPGNVINCNFNNNNASSSGGAIFFQNNGTVTNCNFNGNTGRAGGAIFFNNHGTVTNCNFNNNNASSSGGAIFFNNHGTVTNCNFNGNTGRAGGAIYFNDDNGNVINCNFAGNTPSLDGGAVYFSGTGEVTNCNFTDNIANRYGGAVYFARTGSVTNCNFTDNIATSPGGAVYFARTGSVTNCNFTNNTANDGGAVYFWNPGNVTNCNFAGNTANDDGGAVYFENSGNVINCNFAGNTANDDGGAVYFRSNGEVTNCNFSNNSASRGGAILSQQWWVVTADTCIFKTDSDTTFNTHNLPPTLNVNNFTTFYNSGEKLTFDLKTNSSIPVTNGNISISVYFKDGDLVGNYSCLSGEGWIPDLPVGSYIAFFDTEYAEFQKINRTVTITMPNVRYSINVSSVTTNNKTVNITAKTDIPKDILWEGKLLFILPNNINITANYAGNGTWWANYTFDKYGEFEVRALYIGLNNVTVNNATITINKIKTELSADAVATTYNVNKYLTITLKDVNGNPLKGITISVDLNGAKKYTTDANGQVKVPTKGLAPKTYTAKVTFNGNDIYEKSAKNVKVTVKKAASKLTAGKKTFKAKTKVKKYAAVLKDSTGKAIKKAKLTLKVKGKTYAAKTNSKGKAIFKITKLNKKGTFKGVIKFNGNKYYTKAGKNVKITVKASKSKTTFKTVSKGSKDKKTVKKIQQALKDHGYYLTYQGHYLKVDGKFESCTERSVKQFQSDHGLKVTGKVDAKTAKKLGII